MGLALTPFSALATCYSNCTTNYAPPEEYDFCFDASEGQTECVTIYPEPYESCTEVCVDVNDYSEVQLMATGSNDWCLIAPFESCFDKNDIEYTAGRGNVAWYQNSYTTSEYCDSEGQCVTERTGEQRLSDSGGRYDGNASNWKVDSSTLWGLVDQGTENNWWMWAMPIG